MRNAFPVDRAAVIALLETGDKTVMQIRKATGMSDKRWRDISWQLRRERIIGTVQGKESKITLLRLDEIPY